MTTPPSPPPPAEPPAAGPPPAAPGPPSGDDRNWAVAAHLSALVVFVGIPSLVGPLVVWLIKREQHPFIDDHGREALNFNLSLLLYVLVGGLVLSILTVVTLGLGLLVLIPAAIAALVLWAVFLVQAAMQASRGQPYRYPLTIRFVS